MIKCRVTLRKDDTDNKVIVYFEGNLVEAKFNSDFNSDFDLRNN